MIVASSSPVKFSNIVFPVWNFWQSLKLHYKNNLYLSVIANHSKLDFFSVNWLAESEEIR